MHRLDPVLSCHLFWSVPKCSGSVWDIITIWGLLCKSGPPIYPKRCNPFSQRCPLKVKIGRFPLPGSVCHDFQVLSSLISIKQDKSPSRGMAGFEPQIMLCLYYISTRLAIGEVCGTTTLWFIHVPGFNSLVVDRHSYKDQGLSSVGLDRAARRIHVNIARYKIRLTRFDCCMLHVVIQSLYTYLPDTPQIE